MACRPTRGQPMSAEVREALEGLPERHRRFISRLTAARIYPVEERFVVWKDGVLHAGKWIVGVKVERRAEQTVITLTDLPIERMIGVFLAKACKGATPPYLPEQIKPAHSFLCQSYRGTVQFGILHSDQASIAQTVAKKGRWMLQMDPEPEERRA